MKPSQGWTRHFEPVVSDDDDRLPADVVIEHGKASGLTQSVEFTDD